ncbi:Uncharacterized protein YmdB [hydrothermal vent metagenome]|uniref:Uncharacterized protein YmdB n=1 Tax=hydrothermal vent metagenome TaxID=652676 RepID=A0A3B0TP33_9ZZZZ
MNILCVGDVVGKPGRKAIECLLKEIVEEYSVDFIIVNAENSAGGAGLTPRIAKALLQYGCNVLTLGDHVWDQKELEEYLQEADSVIRPANIPSEAPGKGWCIKTTKSGIKVGVVNLLGRVFMRHLVACPFLTLKKIVQEIRQETPIIIVDMHAETTSEKVAIGHFIDGNVSVVFGTHTHIQTADEKILPGKTAYITDLGMTGPYDSVIGQNKDVIIKKFLTTMPIRFNVAQGEVKLSGIVVDVDELTGNANKIQRIQKLLLEKI